MNANLLNERMKAKGMQTNTKNAIVVSKHFVMKFLKRWQDIWGQTQRGLPKQEIKTRHSFPFTSNNHGNKTFQTMRNVIYAHIVKRLEGKDTLVKDLGKKSQFSHTLKLARLYHWQLAPTGATCSLKTSANAQLAWVANWQQVPMPENEKTKNFSQPRPDSPLQAESPRLKWTM